jgi:tRNA G18 (ribose-2'-O)-methylase SpoU
MSNDRQLEYHQHPGKSQTLPLSLVLHNIELPENVGSIFRLADALGISKLYLCENTCCPPNRKLRKSARSCDKHVEFEKHNNSVALLQDLNKQGQRIIALEITEQSINLSDLIIKPTQACVLVLGNENLGVENSLLKLCESAVHIPMQGHNSSMNVASATAIASYHIINQYS